MFKKLSFFTLNIDQTSQKLSVQMESHSDIIDSGTGNLRLQSSKLQILNAAASEQIANFNENGDVELYYDNSAKFNTAGAGVSVTGGVQVSSGGTFGSHNGNAAVYYGDGSNLTGISTASVPGISTQLHSVFGTINASGIITATSSIKVSGISSIFVGNSLGGDGTREG